MAKRMKCPLGHNAVYIKIKDRHLFPPDTFILCQTCKAYYNVMGRKTGDFKEGRDDT